MEERRLKVAVIREEYMAILDNDPTAAIILNQFIYWSQRVNDFDEFIEEENNRIEDDSQKIPKLQGWIYKSSKKLHEELMSCYTPETIRTKVNILVKKKLLEKRKNPKYKWDHTYQYRLDTHRLRELLDEKGHVLQGYKLLPLSKKLSGIDSKNSGNDLKNSENNTIDYNIEEVLLHNTKGSLQLPDSSDREEIASPSNKDQITKFKKRNNITSTKKKTSLIPLFDPTPFHKRCLDTWNKNSLGTKHNLNTKTAQRIFEYLDQLSEGTFSQRKSLKQEFLEKNNITPALLNKKWTKKELLLGIKNLTNFYVEGFWPANKDKLPRGFDSMIYNPRSGTSFFLMALISPPKPLNSSPVNKFPDYYTNIFDLFKSSLEQEGETISLNANILYGIDSIVKFHKKIPAEEAHKFPFDETDDKALCSNKIVRAIGSPYRMCMSYMNYLKYEFPFPSTSALIKTECKPFKQFIREIEQEFGIKIN